MVIDLHSFYTVASKAYSLENPNLILVMGHGPIPLYMHTVHLYICMSVCMYVCMYITLEEITQIYLIFFGTNGIKS